MIDGRPTNLGIDARLELARSSLERLAPGEIPDRLADGAVLVDIRPAQPFASYDLEVIVICQEGYTSSLAAESLQELGVRRATDVIGGFAAWKAAGLPVTAGDAGR